MTATRFAAVTLTASVALVGSTSTAAAQEVTSTSEVSWHGDNGNGDDDDDRYAVAVQRLFASTVQGRWLLAAQLDGSGFISETGAADDPTRYQDTFTAEKVWLAHTDRDVEVAFGDSYVAFGRGLGLTLRKVDELAIDTTLRGAKLQVRRGRVDATVTAGFTNMTNVDLASGQTAEDPLDLVGGAQVMVNTARGKLGMHAETIAFKRPLTFIPDGEPAPAWADRWVLAGPVLDLRRLTKNVSLYGEGVVQERGDGRGFGGYLSGTWLASSRVSVQVEGKAYGDLEVVQPRFDDEATPFAAVRYTTPPTVERLLEPLEHPQRETWGGRARTDVRLGDRLLVYGNYGLFRDHVGYLTEIDPDMPPTIVPGTIHDPYAGLEMTWNDARSRAAVSAGTRLVYADVTNHRVRSNAHVEYDVVQVLGPRLSAQLHGYHMRRGKAAPPFVLERWDEGTAGVALAWAGKVTVGGLYDYSTEMVAAGKHLGGTLEWRPSERMAATLFAGGTRGGLRCVSGVCRELPPFQGVRVSMIYRY